MTAEADVESGAEAAAPAKKKLPIMLIAMVAAAVVLLGGGAAAYFFIFAAPKPADAADALALAIGHLWRGQAENRLTTLAAGSRR